MWAIEELRDIKPLNKERLASALGNLGELYFLDDQPELAQEKYTDALELLADSATSIERPWLLHNQAMLWYHLGEYKKAEGGYYKARETWTSRFSADHPFVAGGSTPTIADCTLFAALNFGRFFGVELDPRYANVGRWFEAFCQRPSAS